MKKLAPALAETIATMIQALRMGESARARQLGLTALAVYCSQDGNHSVEQLLADADPGLLGEGPRIEGDAVAAKDLLQVLDAAHSAACGLVRPTDLVTRKP